MGRLALGATGAATVLLALAALTACSAPAVRDGDTGEVTQGGDIDVFTLHVGDCFSDSAQDEVSDVPVVPCTEAHDDEVFAEFDMPDGDFPGKDAFDSAASEQCDPEFAAFVGTEYTDSDLEYFTITPTADGWDQLGDRVVQCAVYDPSGRTTGSLKGTAR